MIRAEVLDALLEAGASAEMIVAAVKAAASAEEAKRGERRARDAARQRRVRGARAASAESRSSCVTPRDGTDVPPNEINLTPHSPRSSDEDLAPLAGKLAAHGTKGPERRAPCPAAASIPAVVQRCGRGCASMARRVCSRRCATWRRAISTAAAIRAAGRRRSAGCSAIRRPSSG